MNRKRITKWFFLTISGLLAVFIFLFLSVLVLFPKYFGLEYLFSKNGISILSKTVEEDLNSLKYLKGKIFYKEDPVGNFSTISVKSFPIPKLLWECSKGQFQLKPYFGYLKADFSHFGCTKYAETVEGELNIKRNELFGDLTLKGIKIENLPVKVKRIILHFEGRKFKGTVEGSGITLHGGGKVDFDLLNLGRAKMDATFEGSGLKLHIYGNLFNPRYSLR